MSSSLSLGSPSTMATRIINPHTTTSISKPSSNFGTLISTINTRRKRRLMITSKASPPSPSSPITEFDLYELLGVESSSSPPEIKKAYRTMQKRCHPDIAGAIGHDMAIILNEAYAVLSDPVLRSAYDKEQAKMVDVRGYTGKPLYSAWLGPETEQRAIFVDEVKCVGCLKCALFASNTFAIESVYGRARVVAQWADPENVIQEAIDACPVDCISTVERSELPVLEYLMSKQPRGRVRIGVGNTVAARVTDVFTEAKLFQKKLESQNKKYSAGYSMGQDSERNRTMSAILGILSISSWLYQRPLAGSPPSQQSLTRLRLPSPSHPRLDKLKMAAAARKTGKSTLKSRTTPTRFSGDDYWVPSTPVLPPVASEAPKATASTPAPAAGSKRERETRRSRAQYRRRRPVLWGIPAGAAAVGAVVGGLEGARGGGLEEHVAGAVVLGVVNSFWMQVVLAGVSWYVAGIMVVGVIEAVGRYDTD